MAETIKAVSDDGLIVTIVIVDISDTVEQLIEGHASIERCSEEILMTRLNSREMQVLIESRIAKLDMKIAGDAKWMIINLSKGRPAFGHALGKGATISAIDSRKSTISETKVDYSIEDWLGRSQNTLKNDYE